jgi:hypothetical protein
MVNTNTAIAAAAIAAVVGSAQRSRAGEPPLRAPTTFSQIARRSSGSS